MLEKIVTLYRKAEMGVIGILAGTTANVIDETNFYDIGYMQTQISRIKKEINSVTKELEINIELNEDSDYANFKRQELIEQREKLLLHLIFLASNSFGNLVECEKMAKGHGFAFMACIDALNDYKNGYNDKALKLLEGYFQEYGSVEEHYLVNKVFGLLLVEKGLYQKAIAFLSYALQFIPDDMETLKKLQLCYQQVGADKRMEIVNEVLAVLE